jgi:hypothetical protein
MEKQLLSASGGAVAGDVRRWVVVDMKDSRKIGRVDSAALNEFWRRANGFFAFPRCMWLITLDALAGFAAEVRWMAKRLAVKTLTYRLGVLILLPTYDAVKYSFDLWYFTYVSTGLKSDNKHSVFSYQYCVALSVFVIWEIFTTRNFWAVSSACISSIGTLRGLPLRTSRDWKVSGSGYVW